MPCFSKAPERWATQKKLVEPPSVYGILNSVNVFA
jgi:hypothetical protein